MLYGSVFFDFAAPSFQFHQLVERGIEETVAVMLKWKACPAEQLIDDGELSSAHKLLAAHQVIRDRLRQRTFRQAVFAMIHRHGDDPDDPVTLRAGVKVAGMDWVVVEEAVAREGARLLTENRTAADAASAGALPAYLGGGPAMSIELTPAALSGPPRDRLKLIETIANDDGIWVLRKPSG